MSNKAVNIVTFFKSNNYGSNLQAIALSRVLKKKGYEVSFLERFSVKSYLLKHPVLLFAKIYNKIIRKKTKQFFTPIPYAISEKRQKRLSVFREQYFRSVSYIKADEWEKAISQRTVFVAGSDILWNPARGYPEKEFLDFAYYAKLPRFSYASSVGAQKLPKKFYHAYRRYLGSMVEVGVREQSVADMLEAIIHRNVTKVVDPSLLLTADEWDQFSDKAELSVPVSKEGFILCYFVMNDSRYWEYVQKIRKATDKQIIVLPMHRLDEEQPYDVILDGTPYEFIWLIKHADFICTDSFHVCAVSLIYEKDFYLLRRTRKAEDAKYDDFLNRYHLSGRVVTNENEFVEKTPTDYSFAEKQLEKDRAFSFDFLDRTITACQNP